MSYIDAFFDRDRDCIEIVERVNSTREYRTLPAKYTFYYKDPKGKFKSLHECNTTCKPRYNCHINDDGTTECLISKNGKFSSLITDIAPIVF